MSTPADNAESFADGTHLFEKVMAAQRRKALLHAVVVTNVVAAPLALCGFAHRPRGIGPLWLVELVGFRMTAARTRPGQPHGGGWSMAATMTSRLVVDALEMALARRLKGSSSSALVAHSDRGSQYASEHYQRRLIEERIECSMSRRGNCWDNAAMESFFASLKKELVHDEDYATREEAKASIFEYIETFYNRVRRHSTLGYVAPAEHERTYNLTHR